jgi:nucleoid-associated protein YgaU
MAMNPKRFSRRYKFVNYEAGVTTQYSTPTIFRITQAQRRSLTEVPHIWKTGDRFYKLAATYYGRPQLWWVIAMYNNKPTEGHVKLGDVITIPTPIEQLLRYL